MKFLALTLAFILAVTSRRVSAENLSNETDDFVMAKNQAVTKCSMEHNISEDAITDIMNHIQVAQDEEVKCWVSCVMKTLEIFKERSIDWPRFEDLLLSNINNEEKAKVDQIVEICRSQVDEEDENDCQLAYSLADCKIKHWNEFDLPNGNWEHSPA